MLFVSQLQLEIEFWICMLASYYDNGKWIWKMASWLWTTVWVLAKWLKLRNVSIFISITLDIVPILPECAKTTSFCTVGTKNGGSISNLLLLPWWTPPRHLRPNNHLEKLGSQAWPRRWATPQRTKRNGHRRVRNHRQVLDQVGSQRQRILLVGI